MSDLSEFVTINNSTLTTDSKRVAKHFKKRHANVLRAFDNLGCGEEFNRLNFESVEETDAKGESRRVLRMTKNGFMLLVMGFTGPEAMQIKIAYMAAFDAMADQLQRLNMMSSLSLWEQMKELEKRDATSFSWASFGSRRMLERQRELPAIRGERERLEKAIQPELQLVHSDTAVTNVRTPERVAAANEPKRRKRPAA